MSTIKTNVIPLFAKTGQFYSTATWKYSQNKTKRTFTVEVTGVRGYCKYGWNFKQNIYIGIGNSAQNAKDNAKYITIPASGSNTYTGWLPKSGDKSVSISETFSYDDWGNPSTVYIYLRDYNSNVHWINANKNTVVDVSANVNITGNIAKIGVKDNTPPSIELHTSTNDGVNWNYSVTSDVELSSLVTTIDGNHLSNPYSGLTKITNGIHTIKCTGIKKSNGLSSSDSQIIDSELPSIISASLTVDSDNTALLTFTASHNVDYKVAFSDGTYYPSSGWVKLNAKSVNNIKISIPSNIECTAKLIVRRINISGFTYFTSLQATKSLGICDSVLPTLTSHKLLITGNTTGKLTGTTSHNVNYAISLDNKLIVNTKNNAINIDVTLPYNTESKFTITIYRKDNSKLSNKYSISYNTLSPMFTVTNIVAYLDKVTFRVNNLTSLPIKVSTLGEFVELASKQTNFVTVNLPRTYNEFVEIKGMRVSNENLVYTNKILVDNRQVKVKNITLTPSTMEKATLNSTMYDITDEVPWKCELLYDSKVIHSLTGKGPKCVNELVTIIPNSLLSYKLKITRIDNSNLIFTSENISLDSRYPSDYTTVIQTYEKSDGSYSLTDGLFSYIPSATEGRDMKIDYVKIVGEQYEKNTLILNNPREFTYRGLDITTSKSGIVLPNIFDNDILKWEVTLRHSKNKFTKSFTGTTDARYPNFEISLGQTYGASQDIIVNPTRDVRNLHIQYKKVEDKNWISYSNDNFAVRNNNNTFIIRDLNPGDQYSVRVQGSLWDGEQSSKLYNTSSELTFTAQGGAYICRNTSDNKNKTLVSTSMYIYYPEKDEGEKWIFLAPYIYTNSGWKPLH